MFPKFVGHKHGKEKDPRQKCILVEYNEYLGEAFLEDLQVQTPFKMQIVYLDLLKDYVS